MTFTSGPSSLLRIDLLSVGLYALYSLGCCCYECCEVSLKPLHRFVLLFRHVEKSGYCCIKPIFRLHCGSVYVWDCHRGNVPIVLILKALKDVKVILSIVYIILVFNQIWANIKGSTMTVGQYTM